MNPAIVLFLGLAAAVEGFHVQHAGSALSSVQHRTSRSSAVTQLQAKANRPTTRTTQISDNHEKSLYKLDKTGDRPNQYQSPRNQQVVAYSWDVQENLGLPHEAKEQDMKKGLLSLRIFVAMQAAVFIVRNFTVKLAALLLAPVAPVLGLIAMTFGYTRNSHGYTRNVHDSA
mmetsp:Transcript_5224/g.3670  ORF Transcript_5224/g.3670 Transcript_5224/m.3670 type:complete len:172 (+) Transcript_5224:2-517(+)